MYTNARSIVSKRDELIVYAETEKPDLILITESWINSKDKHLLAELSIPGYKTFEQK